MALSHPPGSRLPLLSARPAVTFPTEECHRPSATTKLYCLVTEAHGCEQLAQGCYLTARRPLSHQCDALDTRLSSHPVVSILQDNLNTLPWYNVKKSWTSVPLKPATSTKSWLNFPKSQLISTHSQHIVPSQNSQLSSIQSSQQLLIIIIIIFFIRSWQAQPITKHKKVVRD